VSSGYESRSPLAAHRWRWPLRSRARNPLVKRLSFWCDPPVEADRAVPVGRSLMSTAVRIVLSAWCVVRLAALPAAFQAPAATEAGNAKTWIGREKEIEEYLKTAEVVKMSNTSVGVTKPRHTYLAPGGPVSEMAWKALPPGRQA